jgi:hypothetical protein
LARPAHGVTVKRCNGTAHGTCSAVTLSPLTPRTSDTAAMVQPPFQRARRATSTKPAAAPSMDRRSNQSISAGLTQLLKRLINREARCLLTGRIILKRREEPANVGLRWDQRKSMVEQPIVIGVRRDAGALVWIEPEIEYHWYSEPSDADQRCARPAVRIGGDAARRECSIMTIGGDRPCHKTDARCRRLPAPRLARTVVEGADLAIFPGIGTHSSRRLLLIFSFTSGGMPVPLSRILISTLSPRFLVAAARIGS